MASYVSTSVNATQGFAGANAVPFNTVDLIHARQPCSLDDDCDDVFQWTQECLPLGFKRCVSVGYSFANACEFSILNDCGNDYFFSQTGGTCKQSGDYDTRFECSFNDGGVPDPGHAVIVGQLVVDVPPGARGKFVIPHSTIIYDYCPSGVICETYFEPAAIEAVVFIGEDCNNNVVLDELDIAQGTSQDVNNNGVPDSCEGPVPAVTSWGLAVLALLLLIAAKIHLTSQPKKKLAVSQ